MQTITEDWADGTYSFRLRYGEWIELQSKIDKGPLELLQRLMSGAWRVHELRETIRLGLIGGGATPSAALTLVKNYVEQRPMLESVPIALRIVEASLYAPPSKEGEAGEHQAGTVSSGELTPLNSTETPPQ
jgi:Phage tail tube protein, GTA-gp10